MILPVLLNELGSRWVMRPFRAASHRFIDWDLAILGTPVNKCEPCAIFTVVAQGIRP